MIQIRLMIFISIFMIIFPPILHLFHLRGNFLNKAPKLLSKFTRLEMYFMKLMFFLENTDFFYSNSIMRALIDFISWFIAHMTRPAVFTRKELKKVINNIYKVYNGSPDEAPVILIRPCPCRDALGKYSKKIPNITDVILTNYKNSKKYEKKKNVIFITRKQLFKKFDEFEKAGLVPISLGCCGMEGFGKVICNCHKSVCYVLRAIIGRDIKRGLRKGPSIASVDLDKCTGVDNCGICLERCVFHARDVIDNKAIVIEENCYGCGLCATSCPTEATEMVPREDWWPTFYPLSWLRD